MKRFTFFDKHSSAFITLKANSFEEVEKTLFETVKYQRGWYVEDEEGEEDY